MNKDRIREAPTVSIRFRPTCSMKIMENTFPGRLARAKMKESAYGFDRPMSSKSLVIHVERP